MKASGVMSPAEKTWGDSIAWVIYISLHVIKEHLIDSHYLYVYGIC